MKAKEIHTDFQNTLGDFSHSYSTVVKYTNEFKSGWESLEDDLHSGQLRYAITPKMIAEVHNIVSEDNRLKFREITEALGISSELVSHFD